MSDKSSSKKLIHLFELSSRIRKKIVDIDWARSREVNDDILRSDSERLKDAGELLLKCRLDLIKVYQRLVDVEYL